MVARAKFPTNLSITITSAASVAAAAATTTTTTTVAFIRAVKIYVDIQHLLQLL